MYKTIIKPFFDFLIASIVFLVASPILLLVIILLAYFNSGKVFFVQKRPGKNGKIFSILKFKTMNDKTNENGELLPDADRLTLVGKIVRKTSLDELPQLLNVIKGDMSLIGPRPLLVEYLPLYNERQKKRHDAKPGITGWAQINGRNAISWEKKFELDVYYVENLSFSLDVLIIFKTIKKIFFPEGISQEGQATMEKFKGSNNVF